MNKSKEQRENYIFVELLKKYKIILEPKRSTNKANRTNKKSARVALTKEFNEKCHTKLSVPQIVKKLNNFKFRIRKKNFESLSMNEKPRFSAVEETFLSLWGDSGIDLSKKTKTKISELPSDGNRNEHISEDSNNSSAQTDITDETDQPDCIEYPNFKVKSEDNYGSIKQEQSQTTTEPFTLHNWDLESDSESDSSLNDFDDNDDTYASMTLDELKRAVLISQSKMLKAAEGSARAKEKLKLFELSLLQRNNRNEIPHFF